MGYLPQNDQVDKVFNSNSKHNNTFDNAHKDDSTDLHDISAYNNQQ